MYPKDENTFVLETGKEFYANKLILGINPNQKFIYHGYDGITFDIDSDVVKESFTKYEIAEICDYMIKKWMEFKEKEAGPYGRYKLAIYARNPSSNFAANDYFDKFQEAYNKFQKCVGNERVESVYIYDMTDRDPILRWERKD